jgi:hypothetical protein
MKWLSTNKMAHHTTCVNCLWLGNWIHCHSYVLANKWSIYERPECTLHIFAFPIQYERHSKKITRQIATSLYEIDTFWYGVVEGFCAIFASGTFASWPFTFMLCWWVYYPMKYSHVSFCYFTHFIYIFSNIIIDKPLSLVLCVLALLIKEYTHDVWCMFLICL